MTLVEPPRLEQKSPAVSPISPPFSRWLIPSLFILFSALMAILSTGFLEADEITHFLRARAIWTDWRNLLDIWGRFGANLLYGLAAPLGITAARLVAVAVTALTGLAAALLARHFTASAKSSWLARHATAFAWLLFFAQPCVPLYGFTVMTEMLLACCWAWALTILILRWNRPTRGILLASFILGLGGLMRPEGWLAVAVWPLFAFLWLRRPDSQNHSPWKNPRHWPLWLLAVFLAGFPCLLWYLLGLLAQVQSSSPLDWLWVAHGFPYAVHSQYGKTGQEFIANAIASMAVWMWIPILIGMTTFLSSRQNPDSAPNTPARFQLDGLLLLIAPLAALFLVHGLLGSLGLFGSMSMARYFISIAPLAAVLALLGLIQIETIFPHLLSKIFCLAVIALCLFAPFSLVYLHWLPTPANDEMARLDVVADELRLRIPAPEMPNRLIIGQPYLILILNLPISCPATNRIWSHDAMANAPLGTLLVTDSTLWPNEKRPDPALLQSWGYRIDEDVAGKVDAVALPSSFDPDASKVRLWIKEKIPATQPDTALSLNAASAPPSHPPAPPSPPAPSR